MPRHGGSTRRTQRNKHQGHRMHPRGRLARRLKARVGRLRTPVGWSPSMRWDDSIGQWVL